MKKVIFGFTGLIASGKGEAAKYLKEKYGADTLRYSTMLRDILNRLYLAPERDKLIKLSESIRETFGDDVMAKVMAEDAVKSSASIVVIEGIRRLPDIDYPFFKKDFVLVAIDADAKTRYARLIKRGENTDDNQKTFEQFLADQERSTEKTIAEVLVHATEHVDNNGSEKKLHTQLDALIEKYAGSN